MSPLILRSLSATAVALIVATSTAVADPQYPCGKNPTGHGSCCIDNPLARGCSVRSVPKLSSERAKKQIVRCIIRRGYFLTERTI
jgi:hypothetical protein